MRALHRLLIKPTLFFSWFISFAIFNFEGANWGLQWGWVFAVLFCTVYTPSMLLNRRGYRFFAERRFVGARRLFLVVFGFTGLAWLCVGVGLIDLPEPELFTRTVGHTGYLLFYAAVFLCVYHFLRRDEVRYWEYFRWFFIYPFVFIAIWGIYQNLSTYDFVAYAETFNNSLSTGFTYERFKDAHRVSSVFPEPSEYSYYLALMAPIVWACFRDRLPDATRTHLGWLLLGLWIVQAAMVRSLSFFAAVPLIAFVCVRHVEGKRALQTTAWLLVLGVPLVGAIGIGLSDRIGDAAAGADGSILVRYEGLLEALDLFQRSPVIGFGYGVIRGLDALSFTLASFGILGTLVFWLALNRFLLSIRVHATPILSGAALCLIAACILSNNVLDHIFIWMLIAVLAACPKVPAAIPRRKVMLLHRARVAQTTPAVAGPAVP